MVSKYDHNKVEAKWQDKWAKDDIYRTTENASGKNKNRYVLDMFPYPSGATMHVGHLEGYVGTDILSRYLRMKGSTVLHPMGWDAFGLPAENYAIKTGIKPDKSTHENIKTFKRQLEISGMSYDWSREIDTSSPEFYKWTQWLFILMFKQGLAYKAKAPVNWCPKDETVLANEQVVDGRCERCDTPVIQKELDQWFLKITAYADRLISGLDKIDWPDEVKRQQVNWIGRSEGMEIEFEVGGSKEKLKVFTTRPDTNFGATFIVVAPEHEIISKITTKDHKKEVEEYIKKAKSKSEEERIEEGRKKTGVFTGSYAVNQLNGYKMPIWISDFVLSGFGTGAVVGVPGHDKRDFEFAKEFNIPIVRVVVGSDGDKSEITKISQVQEENGVMVNSGFLNGMDIHKATEAIIDYIAKKGWGKRVISYHIRDWLISRQRYWGCPIPMIYCKDCGWQPVPDVDLPVLLPTDVDFLPHGESPIARSKTFQKGVKCPKCGSTAKREVDTMDTYVDSSWYFMRFCDPKNDHEFASKDKLVPVDDYVGGGHVVQHLLFARFFWKVLYDEGLIDKSVGDEPFLKLRAPGWILGPDSRKMSKRWGNVVTPDDIIPKFGADTLRVYEMFMGPFDVMKPWSTSGVEGAARFLNRVWRLFQESDNRKQLAVNSEVLTLLHQTIKKVGSDIENYKFNTAISALMQLVNTYVEYQISNIEYLKSLTLLLAPFAPHMMEEVWVKKLGMPFSIHKASWPSYEAKYITRSEATIIIQVNGKVRGQMTVESGKAFDQKTIESEAKKDERIQKWLEGKTVRNIVFIPGKIINFVI